ncbi:hypothetical protein ACHAWX_006864 [Stephanocyclus meneghinianus]
MATTVSPSAATTIIPPPTSSSSLLSLLTEPSPQIVKLSLRQLLDQVDTTWHEVAEALPLLEEIAEGVADAATDDDDARHDVDCRMLAAAIASRVYFHLEEPRQALRLALESGDYFSSRDVAGVRQAAYAEKMMDAAIGEYVRIHREGRPDGEEELNMDKLTALVSRQFDQCYADRAYRHALGVAYEARELRRVQEVLDRCLAESAGNYQDVVSTLNYAVDASETVDKQFREGALRCVGVTLQTLLGSKDGQQQTMGDIPLTAKRNACCLYVKTMQLLKSTAEVASTLSILLNDDQEGLLGLQLCFDIVDSGDRRFVDEVAKLLPNAQAGNSVHGESNDQATTRFIQAHRILTSGFTSELHLSFLYKSSHSDPLIMSNLKKTLEERSAGLGGRNSILHNCAVATHGYLNLGTTGDGFLRDNLEWMKKASNWAKFSATASMGVIHAGHTTEAMTLLEPYLPPSPPADDAAAEHTVSSTGGYSEGGSLYALGLIHGSHVGSDSAKRAEANAFLRRHLRSSHANEVISHGAALGVGLTSFGSWDMDAVNELKELLYTDSAVAGEAASIAIGMVLAGSGAGNASSSPSPEQELLAEIVAELRNYSRETQHEKIIRGIAICLALINFGQEENADATIEEMRGDRDPVIRYGAMYGLALAYCGTGSNKAVRILLHTAVSDVNDDVRMASVIGLALVLHKTPHRVPELVRLLLESFNPHVRYASCMAVGIAMAGTGNPESIALLEPMLTDMTDYVRQGALLGTAMIYMQQSDTCNHRKVKTFREKLVSIVGDKHQSTLTKMGAILSTGLIDVGGRNCSLSLGSRNGFTKMNSAIGLVLWLQHWHWFPMMHMLSLAVTPTCTIGLNKDFKYPKKFEILCHAKPSVFAYPRKLEEKKEEKKKRVETVTLSTTAKNRARLARKRAKEEAESTEGEGAMDIEKKAETKQEAKTESMKIVGVNKDTKPDEEKAEEKPKKKREPEPTSYRISNPSRVTKAQAEVCSFDLKQRYRPIRPEETPYGVIMLTDSTPGEEEDLGVVKTPAQEEEADPPEPFEWTPPSNHGI